VQGAGGGDLVQLRRGVAAEGEAKVGLVIAKSDSGGAAENQG
jgi:hypothetical protein